MASDDSPSSSSSSSSSSDEELVASKEQEQVEGGDGDEREERRDGYQGDADDDDNRKAFLSRIPQTFDNDSVKSLLESKFGDGCASEVSIVYDVPEDEAGESDAAGKNNKDTSRDNGEKAKGRERDRGNDSETKSNGTQRHKEEGEQNIIRQEMNIT